MPYRRYYQVKSYDSGTTKTTYFTTDGNALTSSNSLDTSKATLSYQTISATNGYQPLISNSDGTITTSVSRGTDGGGSYSSYYVLKYSPDDPTTYKFKDSRSVADTHINPANVGITFQSIEANYKFSNKWFMNLGYWLTHSDKVLPANNSFYQVSGVYQRTRLGEIQLGVQPTHKWRLTANLAKSDRNKPVMQSGYEDYQTGKQNTAWMFGAQYGRYSKDVPHTWATVLNIGRCGNQSYIKSGYDMKNDSYGGKGLEWYYLYVPRKNVVASFRYMLIEPLEARIHNGGREDYRQEEFRGEIDWFF